jgi:polyphosphate kinase
MFFDRDLSWLSFNKRVLMEAENETVPLYERIKFLAIYSSNLDEFFRVRVAFLKRLAIINKEKLNSTLKVEEPQTLLSHVLNEVKVQQNAFGQSLRNSILPSLRDNKVHLYYSEPFLDDHKEAIRDIFYTQILSFIQPIVIPSEANRSIYLEDRGLYMVAELTRNDEEFLGIVNIPSEEVSRFQALPICNGMHHFAFIDDIVKHYLHVIFSGYTVVNSGNVKLNRDAELFLSDDYSENISQKIKKHLSKRKTGLPSRFLFDSSLSSQALLHLRNGLNLSDEDMVEGGAYHNLNDLFALPNPVGQKLENPPFSPLSHPSFQYANTVFEAIDKEDVLLSFPYQKYDYILRFFNEAAIDPQVTNIKATLYRVAQKSHITNALISAARNGKKVEVLVEAKARFDEENNLDWADKMSDAGVSVIFSSESLKVHSKVALVTRELNDGKTKHYGFFGTGNFNEKTASIYTDYALLSADAELTEELDNSLNFILGKAETPKLKHLLVAQVNMLEKFTELVQNEIANAEAGLDASLVLKINNLEDKKMIKLLYLAAKKGVKIDLIVRGICCLVPVKNISITRIVDRFLEHARVYIFHNNGNKKMYVGSADWMERNLRRRIEIVFPIWDEKCQAGIQKSIDLQLSDTIKAVAINEDLQNVKRDRLDVGIRAQTEYYRFLKRQIEL